MASVFRKSPPVCLGISFVKLLFGRIRFSKTYVGHAIRMKDKQEYVIFRHVMKYPVQKVTAPALFVVRFKFSRLSHKTNKVASIIPMLLITGYPGFNIKMYGVNRTNGYWTGMYQWESEEALEEYKKSFVFGMMNRRAIDSTISSFELINHQLLSYLQNNSQ